MLLQKKQRQQQHISYSTPTIDLNTDRFFRECAIQKTKANKVNVTEQILYHGSVMWNVNRYGEGKKLSESIIYMYSVDFFSCFVSFCVLYDFDLE